MSRFDRLTALREVEGPVPSQVEGLWRISSWPMRGTTPDFPTSANVLRRDRAGGRIEGVPRRLRPGRRPPETEMFMKVRVLIEPDEDGVFVATCPTLPGCVSQGKTREEARQNIIDAIGGYLQSLRKHGEPIPPSITEEVVEIDG